MNRRSNAFRSSQVLIATFAIIVACSSAVHAQIGYSNQENYLNTYTNGNATLDTFGSGVTTTDMIADDIIPIASGAGQAMTGFSFTVANLNTTNVKASVIIRFYTDNNGVPGNLFGATTTFPITFTPGSLLTSNFVVGGGGISMAPVTNGKFWAGLAFNDYAPAGSTFPPTGAGLTGATPAQLNNLGQGVYGPPTVGSSTDIFFRGTSTDSNGTAGFPYNDPLGTTTNLGGAPGANFGWRFTIVPEASTFALFAMGIAPITGIVLAKRRKKS